MNNHLPFNILLVLALATCGLTVFYNLIMREQFAVVVQYTLPVPGVPPQEVQEHQLLYGEEEPEEFDYAYNDYEPETVVPVTFPLELNQAAVNELTYIPQVGDVMAQRIVQYRDVLRGYTDLEQLMDISGIGEKTYETISAYLYIGGDHAE